MLHFIVHDVGEGIGGDLGEIGDGGGAVGGCGVVRGWEGGVRGCSNPNYSKWNIKSQWPSLSWKREKWSLSRWVMDTVNEKHSKLASNNYGDTTNDLNILTATLKFPYMEQKYDILLLYRFINCVSWWITYNWIVADLAELFPIRWGYNNPEVSGYYMKLLSFQK